MATVMESKYNSMLPEGTILAGRYRIDKYLSSGGCGNTYLVTDMKFASSRTRVVIKEFFLAERTYRSTGSSRVVVTNPDNQALVTKLREKFKREAKLIFSLKHPNIVSVSDYFDANDTSYYVMQYVEGGSLAKKLKDEGPLAEEDALRYIRQVLSALYVMHTEGMYHLDLKPANIMLDAYDNAVLIDFGASKIADDESGKFSTTMPLYTRGFAPTEQIEGVLSRLGAWTDIYAVGATLYNLLSGMAPPMPSEILERGEGAFALPDDVSPRTQKAIAAFMQQSRSKRPQSVEEAEVLLFGKAQKHIRAIPEDNTDGENFETQLPSSLSSKVNTQNGSATAVQPLAGATPPTGAQSSTSKTSRYGLMALFFFLLLVTISIIFVGLGKASDASTSVDNIAAADSDSVLEYEDEELYSVLNRSIAGESYPLIGVDGGSFMMGATSEQGSDAYDDEKPAHRVTVGDFFIGAYPVTQKLWCDVMGSLPSDIPSDCRGDNKPVVCVSWNDCQEFIRKLNSRRGEIDLAEFSSWRFRLPTEAEWEYAARGGGQSRGYKYAGSNDINRVAWYSNSNPKLHDVGGKAPNELGIYDMSGNVYEWCSDWYDSDYYKSSPSSNPRGPSSGSYRVLRGGYFGVYAGLCRVSNRLSSDPDNWNITDGFRLVLSP